MMKLNPNFIPHKMDGQAMLVPLGTASFHGLVQGNRSVEVILECLEPDTTQEEIVAVMCDRFEGDEQLIRSDVADVVSKLRGIGAIDD